MHAFVRDLRYGCRNLIKTPRFTAIAILTLALGIGANVAMFTVIHGVLLSPLEFEEPDRLVSLWEHGPDDAGRMHKRRATAGNYLDWRDESESFTDMALFGSAGVNWTGSGEPEQLLGARVTSSYFSVLRVEPVLGRFFSEDENGQPETGVVVLGHGLWQRRFGGSRDVLGQTLTFDGNPVEVIGVLPDGVYPTWPQATGRLPFLPVYQEIFVPLTITDFWRTNRRSHVFGVVARLAAGTTLTEARAEMDTIGRRLAAAYPDYNEGEGVLVQSYMDEVIGGSRRALVVLWGAVGLLLLVACANMAGLLLARSAGRAQEVAVRSALGASRKDLLRQFLAESLLLGVAGGLLGMSLAAAGLDVLLGLSPRHVPRLASASIDTAVVGFALAISIAAGLLLGLLPALQMSKRGPTGQRTHKLSASGGRLRSALVVSELATAMVLAVFAGLLVQSFWQLNRVDLGFRPSNVLVAEIALPQAGYDDPSSISSFYDALLERLVSLPPVSSAAFAYDHPLDSNWIDSFRLVGGTETDESLAATFRIVTSDYFRTAGIDVVRGRAFTELDDPEHPGAVIVNEAFVGRYLPDVDPLGQRIETTTPSNLWEGAPRIFEIVGVVRNVKFLGPSAADEPAFYVPSRQFPVGEMTLLVRSEENPVAIAPRVREELWSLDNNLPINRITTLERLLDGALAESRFSSTLLGLFAGVSLGLAAMGVFGLISHTVTQRTSEIGIRMALGARSKDVLELIVRQGVRLAAIGLLVGTLGALAATRVLDSLLFEVSARDPLTIGVVGALLGAIALLASFLPARRAARIAPVRAIRWE